MKYIRTKDDIRPICGKNHITNTVSFYDKRERLFSAIVEDSRIANTIEELCDEFVVMSCYSFRHDTFKTLRNAIKHSKLFPFEVMYIYGAIWTDKGLIYVAKMNDKGELELL